MADVRPKKVILCVDDNEQDLSVLCFLLYTNGFRSVAAASGEEAIGIFGETPVDLVLTDFSMPNMNGDQLVRRLKQIAPHIPMIILGNPQTLGDYLYAADAFLNKKACSAEEILNRVKQMSARKRGPRRGSTRVHKPNSLLHHTA